MSRPRIDVRVILIGLTTFLTLAAALGIALTVNGKTSRPGARTAGVSLKPASQPPPVQVLVTKLTPVPGRFVYRYTVVNGSAFPITSVLVGHRYYYGDELAYAPMGWDGATVPTSGY